MESHRSGSKIRLRSRLPCGAGRRASRWRVGHITVQVSGWDVCVCVFGGGGGGNGEDDEMEGVTAVKTNSPPAVLLRASPRPVSHLAGPAVHSHETVDFPFPSSASSLPPMGVCMMAPCN